MNVLIVGSGGREHALARKLAQSPRIGKLLIAPGNPGTALLGQNVPVGADDYALLVHMARAEQVDLAVIGPEAPLAAGLADSFAAAGIATFGPSAAAAQIESSKIFAKQIMRQAGVPTADAHAFDDTRAAIEFARSSGQPWVVKADGLAAGKGVVVAGSVEATVAAIELLGATSAGSRLLLEQPLAGDEVSVLALCDGERLLPLPPARDHKRLLEGDRGPNTGGMGAYAPSDIGAELFDQIVSDLMLPVVRELAAAGTPFRGALYAGVMLTPHGPRVLEFNARFGDPETQVLVPLLPNLLDLLVACTEQQLQVVPDLPASCACATVVLAAPGYPGAYPTGAAIHGLDALIDQPDLLVFHAGTARQGDQIVTAGGRVLAVSGLGADLPQALARAYAGVNQIHFTGMHYRKDIGVVYEM